MAPGLRVLAVLCVLLQFESDALQPSPTFDPAEMDDVEIRQEEYGGGTFALDDDAPVYDYHTKIKRAKFFHHHYVYHHADKQQAKKRHERGDHDHEIKVPTEQRIAKLYHLVDLDKDGVISEAELASVLHQHKRPKWHPAHKNLIDAAITRMDLNSDGVIEKHEYIEHMRQSTKAFSKKLLSSQVPKEDLSVFAKLI